LQALLELIKMKSGGHEEATLTLAEAAGKDPSVRGLVGVLGGIATLRGVLDTPPPLSQDSLYRAALVAIGVLCLDCPGNMCSLVNDKDLEVGQPPKLAGLQNLLIDESEAVRVAADKVQSWVTSVYHMKVALVSNGKVYIAGQMYNTDISPYARGPANEMAQHAIDRVCNNAEVSEWEQVMPNVILNLLASQDLKMYWWGVAVMFKTDGRAAKAIRAGCLAIVLGLVKQQGDQVMDFCSFF